MYLNSARTMRDTRTEFFLPASTPPSGSQPRRNPGSQIAAALLLVAAQAVALAGPVDQSTKYGVGIAVGGLVRGGPTGGAIVDSGGTTSLSYEDAIDAGLLDVHGDPVSPPAGTVTVNGTGGASVVGYRFNNVSINVTPQNPDGSPNGDTRKVQVSVYVPQKPANQSGKNDAERIKKTESLITKIGANVVGATIDGGSIKFIDSDTNNPAKNNRGTGWTNSAPAQAAQTPQRQFQIIQTPGEPQDEGVKRNLMQGVLLNGFAVDAYLLSLPTTLIPTDLAPLVGLTVSGTFELDRFVLASLIAEGYIDSSAGESLTLPFGYFDVTLPALDGPFVIQHVAAMINPFSDKVLIGANGLVPAGWDGWFDNTVGKFNLSATATPAPEPGSLLLVFAALCAMRRSKPGSTPTQVNKLPPTLRRRG